jgi:hypothetical protein
VERSSGAGGKAPQDRWTGRYRTMLAMLLGVGIRRKIKSEVHSCEDDSMITSAAMKRLAWMGKDQGWFEVEKTHARAQITINKAVTTHTSLQMRKEVSKCAQTM